MSENKNQNSSNPDRDIWEYKILNLNIDTQQNNVSDPEKDSQKLKGSLSAEFIKTQFPEKYTKKKELHPADQLQNILNILGSEGWELKCIENVGRFLFFFFIRKKSL
ncbi:hypothetical protein [uncultured Prochlorococcus sp.]|uniref:hypothetical protein n=1 Tax=uncultured Prochlorococcus sp. TaxID=159733 RepID=UPI002589795E|nr:hypothetical protein [uncultured Prochlorococcus sp.]